MDADKNIFYALRAGLNAGLRLTEKVYDMQKILKICANLRPIKIFKENQ